MIPFAKMGGCFTFKQFVHIHFELFISKFSYWICVLVAGAIHLQNIHKHINIHILISISTFALWHLWQMSNFQLELFMLNGEIIYYTYNETAIQQQCPSENNKITSIMFCNFMEKYEKLPWIESMNLFIVSIYSSHSFNNRRTFAFSNQIRNRMHVYHCTCTVHTGYNLLYMCLQQLVFLILFDWIIHAKWIVLNSA